MIRLIVYGKPIAAKPPNIVHNTHSDAQREAKVDTRLVLKGQYKGHLLCGSLSVHFNFHMKINPRSLERTRDLLRYQPHTIHPKLHNLIEYYVDCMKSVIYIDTSQISHISATKVWADEPKTEIIIQIHHPEGANEEGKG